MTGQRKAVLRTENRVSKEVFRALPFIFGRTTTQAENSQKLVELNVARHRESGS